MKGNKVAYSRIGDQTQLRPGDILEYRCPRFGLVTQWKVEAVLLAAVRVQSLIEVSPITNGAQEGTGRLLVPEQMTRSLDIIRADAP